MFNHYVGRRKRRVWSPATVVVSVGAHVVLLGAAVSVATREAPAARPNDEVIAEWDLEPKTPPPAPIEVEPPPPPPPAPEDPDVPEPVGGQTVALIPPAEVPDEIPEVDPNQRPSDPSEHTGVGTEGNYFDPTATTQRPVTGGETAPPGEGGGEPFGADVVEELPQLANRAEAQRALERTYPPLLRDAGVTGRTMVLLIIDEQGRVEPGSASVQETTHDAFRDAALRAVERFRFRPAKIQGKPVPVLIAIPIDWKLDR